MYSLSKLRIRAVPLLTLLLIFSSTVTAQKAKDPTEKQKAKFRGATPVLWRDPGDVAARNLSYGPGSAALAPVAPFRFVEEDKSGESPKFEVRDARNVKWVVKLGEEAQSETVSTRLVWAVGYFAEEAYYYDRIRISNLPKLSRGRRFVYGNSIVRGARFEPRRSNVERGSTWGWDKNPFADSRELDGLKVIMILLNNFDARAANNRIFYIRNRGRYEAHYVVSDLGATLGRAGGLGGTRTKNNLEDFLSTGFVLGVDDGAVKFDYDTRPTKLGMLTVVYPPYYLGEVNKEKSMRGIPVEHARWIGSLLSRLTDEQLRDAFEAARYHAGTREGFVRSLRERIDQLSQL
jgi:hypothetical protein